MAIKTTITVITMATIKTLICISFCLFSLHGGVYLFFLSLYCILSSWEAVELILLQPEKLHFPSIFYTIYPMIETQKTLNLK